MGSNSEENKQQHSSSNSNGTDLSSANMDALMGTVTKLVKDMSLVDTFRRATKTESASQSPADQLMPIQQQLEEIAKHLAEIKEELQQIKEQKKEKGWFF